MIVRDLGLAIEYNKLPEGMTEKEAYRQFMDALGYLREGPWIFKVKLTHETKGRRLAQASAF
jgi:hypothetical protein